MATYILDTNIISYLWDNTSKHHFNIVKKLSQLKDSDNIAISIVSIYELNYGIKTFKKNNLKQKFENAINLIKKDEDITIYSLDIDSADSFAELKDTYKKNTGITNISNKKNDLDFIIASISISNNAVLVSNDKIFKDLKKILPLFKYENWLD